jgi:hypothetical protein
MDVADISGSNSASALFVQTIENGNASPTNTAYRQAIQSKIAVHGQVGATGTAVDFVGQLSMGYATASQGGSGGWTAGNNPDTGYFRGSLFGGNDNVYLTTGGSNYWVLCGREIDTGISGTANVYQRIGLLEVVGASTRQADGDDCGIAFVSGTNGHKNAIQFGSSVNDCHLTDALIKVVNRAYPSPVTSAFVAGLDFTAATFSGNALATPGFAVSGAGHTTSTGASFGSAFAPGGARDLSRHLDMYGGLSGFSATSGCLNYVVPAGANHVFYVGTTDVAYFQPTGLAASLGQGGIVLPATVSVLRVNGNSGFNNTAPIAKPTVTGSKGANAALASLLIALASYGLVTDSST